MEPHVDVLVVGAGPAGLALAVALARQGVKPLVIDRNTEISTHPKATSLSLRTMELLRGWGLADAARAGGVEVEWQLLAGPTLARHREGQTVEVGYPTAARSALISPERPASVPQDHLEALLERHLGDLGVRVRRGVELVSIAAGAVRLRSTGREFTVHPRYIVAADGIRSRVRAELGMPVRESGVLEEGVGASFRAPIWPVLGDRRFGIYVTTAQPTAGIFLPAGPPDRWFWGQSWAPGAGPGPLTPAAVIARIRAGAGVPDLPVALERTGRLTYATCVAETFRAGPVFLVGDAAHRVSPRGGTGLNMAIHDGADLGWKLAWVLRGFAGDALLDTYEAERRPVALHNVARSEQADGSRRPADAEMPFDLGRRLPHRWLDDGRSTLDLAGPGPVLITASPAFGALPPGFVTVRRISKRSARSLGIEPGAALLLRPDAVPAAQVSHPAHLGAAVARLVGRPADLLAV